MILLYARCNLTLNVGISKQALVFILACCHHNILINHFPPPILRHHPLLVYWFDLYHQFQQTFMPPRVNSMTYHPNSIEKLDI